MVSHEYAQSNINQYVKNTYVVNDMERRDRKVRKKEADLQPLTTKFESWDLYLHFRQHLDLMKKNSLTNTWE